MSRLVEMALILFFFACVEMQIHNDFYLIISVYVTDDIGV